MIEQIKSLIVKAADKAISMKLLVMSAGTWLFYIGKLSEDGWIMLILTVSGFRVLNEVASMYKDVRTAQITQPPVKP